MARLLSDDALAVATIWQESRGEPYEGKVAVGEVIRNRAKLKLFSDGTIAGTVAFPMQFSGWNSRDINRISSLKVDDQDPIVSDCVRAWAESINGNLTGDATHYFNDTLVRPTWAKDMQFITKIGNHSFYK